MKFIIGHDPGRNESVTVDLDRLIDTRLLLQANSGGGKSWLLRRILEKTHGAIQQIVLDVEGEFHTLRENHDYVLARPHDGDCIAHPRVASLLARRLLETGVSAIIDIYDLKAYERHAFVRLFLETLIDAPKKLWHPALIVVDEAHVFAPQTTKSEATGAVIDLMTRGRKRGFCGILATQRISKLHKDAAAEANNKLIGRSALDLDMKRAGDELGFSSREDQLRLRTLQPGEFFSFGPALTETVTLVKVGLVRTMHPRPGQRSVAAPPPTERIKALLPQFGDLPKEAEEEARTIDTLNTKVRELRAELRRRPTTAPNEQQLRAARLEGEQHLARQHRATIRELSRANEAIIREVERLKEHLGSVTLFSHNLDQLARKAYALAGTEPVVPNRPSSTPASRHEVIAAQKALVAQVAAGAKPPELTVAAPRSAVESRPISTLFDRNDSLPGPYRRILDAIAWFETIGIDDPSRIAVSFVAGYKAGTGTINTYFGRLNSGKLICYPSGGCVALTDEGRHYSQSLDAPATTEALHQAIYKVLPGPLGKILRELVVAYPESVDRNDLASRTGYRPGTGTFNTYIGRLRSLRLIDYPMLGQVVALPILFLEERK